MWIKSLCNGPSYERSSTCHRGQQETEPAVVVNSSHTDYSLLPLQMPSEQEEAGSCSSPSFPNPVPAASPPSERNPDRISGVQLSALHPWAGQTLLSLLIPSHYCLLVTHMGENSLKETKGRILNPNTSSNTSSLLYKSPVEYRVWRAGGITLKLIFSEADLQPWSQITPVRHGSQTGLWDWFSLEVMSSWRAVTVVVAVVSHLRPLSEI